MAELKKCDGCGKISPDEKGLHIANGWYIVNVYGPRKVHGEYIFCHECLEGKKPETMPAKLARLVQKVGEVLLLGEQ